MLRTVEPAEQLKSFVRKYVQLEVSAAELWPVPARSITCIEFTFGEPYRIHRVDRSSVEITHPAILNAVWKMYPAPPWSWRAICNDLVLLSERKSTISRPHK